MDNMYDLLVEENISLKKQVIAYEDKLTVLTNILGLLKESENITAHHETLIKHCLEVINK